MHAVVGVPILCSYIFMLPTIYSVVVQMAAFYNMHAVVGVPILCNYIFMLPTAFGFYPDRYDASSVDTHVSLKK
jgi:hypothetical protein